MPADKRHVTNVAENLPVFHCDLEVFEKKVAAVGFLAIHSVFMRQKYRYWLLAFAIVLDTGYSFLQHFNTSLDGDMAAIIVPEDKYRLVMQDPFGSTVLEGKDYHASNRYFAHAAMMGYFRSIPLALQHLTDPVNSVYLSAAILKSCLQIGLIALLAAYSVAPGHRRKQDMLLAALLVVPWFQTFGYSLQMGIIEKAPTYACFYPLPLAFLLAFFLPFFWRYQSDAAEKLAWSHHFWLLPFTVVLPLSGPLVPAVVLLVCPTVLAACWWKKYRSQPAQPMYKRATNALQAVPAGLIFYFTAITLWSLWSLYVGSFNSESDHAGLPLLDRYPALLAGLFAILKLKLGLPLLLLAISINLWLSKRFVPAVENQSLLILGKWVAAFVIVYLLMLPLGGFRSYRSLIVRHDTIMPVTLCLLCLYAKTTFTLIKSQWLHRRWYGWGVLFLSLIVAAADLPNFHHNDCEKSALETISRSSAPVVPLDNDCPILGWNDKLTDPIGSKLNAQLLQIWRVTTTERLYFSK